MAQKKAAPVTAQDVEQMVEEKTLLVMVADSEPFFGGGVTPFSTLIPLMTLDGRRLEADVHNFPGRGRVWFKIRKETPPEMLRPGVLWIGPIEAAPAYEEMGRLDKDRWQGCLKEVGRGHQEVVEVLDMSGQKPDLSLVRRAKRVAWDRPTSAQVLLRWPQGVLGPLRATWDHSDKTLSFAPIDSTTCRARLVPRSTFDKACRCESFEVALHECSPYLAPGSLELTLTLQRWLDEARFIELGEEVDLASDGQVINWAAKNKGLGLSGGELNVVKTFVTRALESAGAGGARLERLRELGQDVDRVLETGEETARVLAESPAYAQLVTEHVTTLAAAQVAALSRDQKKEVERLIATEATELKRLQREKDKLLKEVEKNEKKSMERLREREAQLAGREQALAAEREALSAERGAFAEQQQAASAALEAAAEKLLQADRQALERFLPEVLLRRLGGGMIEAGRSPAPAAVASSTPAPPALAPPLPLPLPPERTYGRASREMKEAAFLEQFQSVVSAAGFFYDPLDLINFHVCQKNPEGITLLCGPSGTGKSSLPRLYAEALGCAEQYLHVPVRPDWLDDRDLLGGFNAMTRRFEPGRAGLAERLVQAEVELAQAGGALYLVNFDEMNLARPEHYLAALLSLWEKPVGERRLALCPGVPLEPSDPWGTHRQVALGRNLRWVGTVNVDETTHFFSPKLLDRSQVLVLQGGDWRAQRAAAKAAKRQVEVTPVPLAVLESWRCANGDSPSAMALIDGLQGALAPGRMHLEGRSVSHLLGFCAAARDLLSEDQALDFQLLQTVFPRLRRSARGFSQVLDALGALIVPQRFPRSAEMLQRLREAEHGEDYFQLL